MYLDNILEKVGRPHWDLCILGQKSRARGLKDPWYTKRLWLALHWKFCELIWQAKSTNELKVNPQPTWSNCWKPIKQIEFCLFLVLENISQPHILHLSTIFMPVLQRCISRRGVPDVAVALIAINWQLIKAIILREFVHFTKLGIKKEASGCSLRLLTLLEIKSAEEVKERETESWTRQTIFSCMQNLPWNCKICLH